MSTELVPMEEFYNGHVVRVFDIGGEPHWAVTDLEAAWGTGNQTLYQIITRYKELFLGHTHAYFVTKYNQNGSESKKGNQSLTLVDEGGLYLVMGKVNYKRLSNPAAKDAILKFQKLVPEIIQKWRQGKISQTKNGAPQLSFAQVIEEEMRIGAVVGNYLKIRPEVVTATVLGRVQQITGKDLECYQKMIPPMDYHDVAVMLPTEIGEEFGLGKGNAAAQSANVLLQALGYQRWVNKKWKPTEMGEPFVGIKPVGIPTRSGKLVVIYQLLWKEKIIDELVSRQLE